MKSRIYFIQKTKAFACITTIRQSDHAVHETHEITEIKKQTLELFLETSSFI